MSVGGYLLYKRMIQSENMHKKLTSFNDRRRAEQKHKLAAVRNDLENERMVLDERARRMPEGVRKYYCGRIKDLDSEIKVLKGSYPTFVGVYDSNTVQSLKNEPPVQI